MTQAELNVCNFILWFALCDDNEDDLITVDSPDWPEWLSKESIF